MEDITNTFSNSPSPANSNRSVMYQKRMQRHTVRKPVLDRSPRLEQKIQQQQQQQFTNHTAVSFAPQLKKQITKPRILHTKRSRLDMLDNSQLTSFPLAPPAQQPEKVTEVLGSPEIDVQILANDVDDASDSYVMEIDPIVLVEDYIKTKQLKRKKLSVADLKSSLKTFDTNDDSDSSPNYLNKVKTILNKKSSSLRELNYSTSTTSDSTLLTKCIVEEDDDQFINESINNTSNPNSLNAPYSIFSNEPSIHSISSCSNSTIKLSDSSEKPLGEFSLSHTTSSLKYCVICESPLYELSSHLASNQSYTEFVCSGCTERYEMLSRLLDDFDQSIADLHPISENIEDIEEALAEPAYKRQKNSSDGSFSTNLINKLQSQLNGSSNNNIQDPTNTNNKQSALWLLEARRKLRWRWRINGLLPQFLNTTEHS